MYLLNNGAECLYDDLEKNLDNLMNKIDQHIEQDVCIKIRKTIENIIKNKKMLDENLKIFKNILEKKELTEEVKKKAKKIYNNIVHIFFDSFMPLHITLETLELLIEQKGVDALKGLIKFVSFNGEFFHNPKYKALRLEAHKLPGEIVDRNGLSLQEAMLNYKDHIPYILSKNYQSWFSCELNDAGTKKQKLKELETIVNGPKITIDPNLLLAYQLSYNVNKLPITVTRKQDMRMLIGFICNQNVQKDRKKIIDYTKEVENQSKLVENAEMLANKLVSSSEVIEKMKNLSEISDKQQKMKKFSRIWKEVIVVSKKILREINHLKLIQKIQDKNKTNSSFKKIFNNSVDMYVALSKEKIGPDISARIMGYTVGDFKSNSKKRINSQ